MSLNKIEGSNFQIGRPQLVKIFRFWFEEDIIHLYNKFKLEQKTYSERKCQI